MKFAFDIRDPFMIVNCDQFINQNIKGSVVLNTINKFNYYISYKSTWNKYSFRVLNNVQYEL